MQPATGVRRIVRFGFYIAVVVLVVAVWRIQHYVYAKVMFSPNTVLLSSSGDAPSQWQQMGFQAAADTNSLLTTLGTALLGALGLLLGNRGGNRPKPRHLWSAFLCAASAGLSLYYGYVSHLHILWMINSQAFDTNSSIYLVPSHAQFYALLVGAFFVSDFAVHNLIEEN